MANRTSSQGSIFERADSIDQARHSPAQSKAQSAGGTFDFGPQPTIQPTGQKNDPRAILDAWTALEALSPQSYKRPEDLAAGDKSRISLLERGAPWGSNARAKPQHHLYFEIILGAIALDQATDELVRVFGEDEEPSRPDGKRAAIASVLIDKDGCLVAENAFAISSFAWALKPALDLELSHLGAWPSQEKLTLQSLDDMFRHYDDDGQPIPIDLNLIHKAHDWLVSQFQIPHHLVEKPSFALKIFHHVKAKTPPEPTLLNSFYLADLATASDQLNRNNLGAGLRRYLGLDRPQNMVDFLSPPSTVKPYVAPSMTPAARWPSAGGHPLVLLQQAAVNAARSDLVGKAGIVGVNGPPGTGKTTLLRDIVVGCVVDRAMAMATFQNPQDAFSTTGEKLAFGSNAFLHFYRLDPSLKGHEIIVASSNNKAVENVSKELPLKISNGRHAEMAYFRSISDQIANPKTTGYADPSSDAQGDAREAAVETWGLMAAALGNGRNRGAFQQNFWWNEDAGFLTYLKAARGMDVRRAMKDEKTGKIIGHITPKVVTEEKPATNESDAATAWRTARAAFQNKKKAIDTEIAAIEKMRSDLKSLAAANAKLTQEKARRPYHSALLDQAQRSGENVLQAHNANLAHAKQVQSSYDRHMAGRPGFFARLFGTAAWTRWIDAQRQLSETITQSAHQSGSTSAALTAARTHWRDIQSQLQQLDQRIADQEQALAALETACAIAHSRLGDRIIDDQFFQNDHESIQLTAPWLPDDVHHLREDLFASALDLHKAFIDATANRLQHNLGLLMSGMTAGAFQSQAHRDLLPDLWSSLFLVVPTLSTTFASVSNMFGDLPPESIGWLLIDEAGQSVPQAAVGGIMRAKRTIVVGDPLQIPPVVSTPEKLNAEICKYLQIDSIDWSAPSASAQTLADQASRFQSTFATDRGDRNVGVPLLVHRRCQNPMFAVSNAVAYSGQMVHAVGPRRSGPIGTILGPSRWVDIQANAETKWSPAEGEAVIAMLHALAEAGVTNPDLFIITPFKVIEQEMRRRLARETTLAPSLGGNTGQWSRNRIGTIHTFQGREADTVILLLGAQNANHSRARQWAANPPNIINVAVSRAKQNLYVVGSSTAWSQAGTSFQILQQSLT